MDTPLPPLNIKKLTKESVKRNDDNEYKSQNRRLREGCYLPRSLRDDDLKNVPIEEFDPYYSNQQTFVVLGYKDLIYRFPATDSLCILSPFNFLRRVVIYLLTHWIFAAVIVTTVLFNCSLLLCPIKSWGWALGIEITFLSIYTFELLVIFVARGGFLDPFTALRSVWTWIDITIIVLGIVACGTQSEKVAGIAAIRILKVIPYIPALRSNADFVFSIVLQLLEVVFYSVVVICGFAIVGMHLFPGSLSQKCISDLSAGGDSVSMEVWNSKPEHWYIGHQGDKNPYKFCGNETGSGICPNLYTCARGYGSNPDYGYTSFDSFPWAVLSVMRIVCQDAVDDIYQHILETAGGIPRNALFFVLLFIMGSFSIFSFTMAIAGKLILERKEYPEEKEETLEEMRKRPTAIVQMDEDGNIIEDDSGNKSVANTATNIAEFLCGWNCEPCSTIRDKLNVVITHPIYEYFNTFIIVLDIFFLCFYYYGIPKYTETILYVIQLVFFSVYIKDTLLRIFALSPKSYFVEWWNTFDFFIAIMAITNTIVWTRAVHNILLVRMLKLVPRWGAAAWASRIMVCAVKRFSGLFVFTLMYIYMFGLIGNHMFSKDYEDNKNVFVNEMLPTWNFSDLPHSFLMIFRILCGEWVDSLWKCMLVAKQSCRLYFFFAVVFGNTILAILFTAVVFSAFDALRFVDSILHPSQSTLEWLCNVVKRVKEQPNLLKMQIKKNKTAQEVIFVEMGEDTAPPAAAEPKVSDTRNPIQNSWEDFQGSAKSLMENKYFNGASIIVIVASSVPLAFDEVNRQPGATWGLHYADVLFTIYFLIEVLVLKVVSRGIIYCVTSFAWVFDFLMILEMVLTLGFYFPYGAYFPSKGYLCIRCLRALMLIARVERLKVVAEGIYKQIKYALDFVQVGLFIWLVFAIIGLHLFNGKFFGCYENESGLIIPSKIVKSKTACPESLGNASWRNAEDNFDRIDKTFVSLTHVASFDSWIGTVESAVNIRGKTAQPEMDANFAAYYYFITFIVIAVFFTFSVIIGASRFYLYKESYYKVFMTSEQHDAYVEAGKKDESKDNYLSYVPEPDILPLKIIFNVATSELFDLIVMGFIILDVIGMGLNNFGSSETRQLVLYWIYFAFTMVFVLELVVKACALRQYFLMSPWNIVDFLIIIYSFISLFIADFLHYSMATRMIRLLRIFQLQVTCRWSKRTRCFIKATTASYSAFLNLLLLLFVFLYTFAVVGMALFKNVDLKFGLNEVANFQTFWNSILLLFKICSFSGWVNIFHGVTNSYDCESSQCGNEKQGRIFIYGCLIISYTIVMNMYSVIILEVISQMDKLDSPGSEKVPEGPPEAITSISASIQEFPAENTEDDAEQAENVFERSAENENPPDETPVES